jgi:hypothetical protein
MMPLASEHTPDPTRRHRIQTTMNPSCDDVVVPMIVPATMKCDRYPIVVFTPFTV